MNAFGFYNKTFQRDIVVGAVKPFKLRMFANEFSMFAANVSGEEVLVLKSISSDDCLGFMSSNNEQEINVEVLSHDQYCQRLDDFRVLCDEFFEAEVFRAVLATEVATDKDVYLVVDKREGSALVVSGGKNAGDDSDHANYRIAKNMGLVD
jgi:hypothetical protein